MSDNSVFFYSVKNWRLRYKLYGMRWIPLFLYFILCVTGYIHFALWSQVTYLWNINPDASELLLHPHGMRYMLVLPFFLLGDYLNMSYDWLFSVTVPVMILVITVHVVGAVKKINHLVSRNDEKILILLISTLVMTLALFMNGRILFSITGSSILLYTLMCWDEKKYVQIMFSVLMSFFLCSVSSGTLFVAVISLCVFLVVQFFKYRSNKNTMLFFTFACALIFSLPLLALLLAKNIDFFGGGFDGFVNMLSHGMGVIFLKVSTEVIWLLLATIVSFLLMLLVLLPYYRVISTPAYMIGVSICGGLFGVSTVMMFVPPILVVLCLMILKSNKCISFSSESHA
jgi:hypothetical protein